MIPAKRPDRSAEIDQFLHHIGWGTATRRMLAGDASFRRYERVTMGDTIAVLMDAPAPWEDVRPFQAMTAQLAAFGCSVPTLIAADDVAGFLLLEDLGDNLFTRLLAADPTQERALYLAATNALVTIARASDDNLSTLSTTLKPYDTAVYLREVSLLTDWFLPQVVGINAAQNLRTEWLNVWQKILLKTPLQQSVFVHRDYHADNLLWLPDRTDHQRIGMLDYQDALLGDPAYDLASLLEDARRDVSPETVADCFAYFATQTGQEAHALAERYSLLAAQRNAKIIGIFLRLTVRDGKAHYMNYLPRVWRHFMHDLTHPGLAPVAQFIEAHVPEAYRGVFPVNTAIGGLA